MKMLIFIGLLSVAGTQIYCMEPRTINGGQRIRLTQNGRYRFEKGAMFEFPEGLYAEIKLTKVGDQNDVLCITEPGVFTVQYTSSYDVEVIPIGLNN